MINVNANNWKIAGWGLLFLFLFILLAILALRPPVAFDSYWHLKMGKDLLSSGLSPWVDHYSFTFQGREISTVPVLFQILLAVFVMMAGEMSGFYLIKLFYISLLMLSLMFYFRYIRAPWFVGFFVLPFIVYFVDARLIVRPELFSNILIVLCLLLYMRARVNFSTKELLYICLLLLFWVNYHSPVIGYIIIFGLFLDKAINKWLKKDASFSWKAWFSWGGIIFLIGFLNPEGHHFLMSSYNLLFEDFSKYTKEYFHSYELYSTNKIVHLMWVFSLYVIVWSMIKKQFGLAFVSIVLTYFSWTTIRLTSPAAIANLCIFAFYLSSVSRDSLGKVKPVIRKGLAIFAVCLAFLAYSSLIGVAVNSYHDGKTKNNYMKSRYPVDVVDYLGRYQDGGNVLNLLSHGGYIINRLAPEYKVYIDGRTNILYPIEFLEHWMKIYKKPALLKQELVEKNIQYAIYKNAYDNMLRFSGIDSYSLSYADEYFLLFARRDKTEFPLASKLFVLPMCWNDRFASTFEEEMLRYKNKIGVSGYQLEYIYAFLSNYLASKNKEHFLSTINQQELPIDAVRRLAAYLALNNRLVTLSTSFFASIVKKDDYDRLMLANSLVKERRYQNAEEMLVSLFEKYGADRFFELTFDKLFVFNSLYDEIKRSGAGVRLSAKFSTQLQAKLDEQNSNSSRMSLQLFATECQIFFN